MRRAAVLFYWSLIVLALALMMMIGSVILFSLVGAGAASFLLLPAVTLTMIGRRMGERAIRHKTVHIRRQFSEVHKNMTTRVMVA